MVVLCSIVGDVDVLPGEDLDPFCAVEAAVVAAWVLPEAAEGT